jgi:ferredoxin--NADP+ reductase
LRKAFSESRISIFERDPVPYGLLRFGVAPDHIGTKSIAQQFERLFEREGVEFIGNMEIGKDKSLRELRNEFDIVVIATGLNEDRSLGISGENLEGIYSAGRITRLLNSHPNENSEGISVGSNIAIIGQGNVAIDLLRLSLLDSEELQSFGVTKEIANLMGKHASKTISVIGRSPIEKAKFDTTMIKEISKFSNVKFTADIDYSKFMDKDSEKRSEAINFLVSHSPTSAKQIVNFYFGWTTLSFFGSNRVAGVDLVSKQKKMRIPVDTVYTAIGFQEAKSASIKKSEHTLGKFDLNRGFLDDGLYCVGWFRRGPVGTIPVSRADAKIVCDAIFSDYYSKMQGKVEIR